MGSAVNIGGAWKELVEVQVNVGGVWKLVNDIQTNVGGAWKDAFYAVTTDLPDIVAGPITDPANSTASYQWQTDGSVDRTIDATQTNNVASWITPEERADSTFDIRYTSFSGDALSSAFAAGEDNWQNLGSEGTMTLFQSGIGTKSCTFTIEIRNDVGTTMSSNAITLSVEVDSGA